MLFFDVLNRSDERVSWRFDDHKFVDADGYLYPTFDGYDLSGTDLSSLGSPPFET